MSKVRWQYRDSRDGEWCRHYRGDYVVECQDMDGDGTEWWVWLRSEYEKKLPKDPNDRIFYRHYEAQGRINSGSDFQIAKKVAIAALEAILADKEEYEAERRAHSAREQQ